MPLAEADRELVVEELGREPTRAEAALFENLWSEHCAYRSSRPLLGAFDSEGERIVVGPGSRVEGVLEFEDEAQVYVSEEAEIGGVEGVLGEEDIVRFAGPEPTLQ